MAEKECIYLEWTDDMGIHGFKVDELIRCKDCEYSKCIEPDDDWWECQHDKRVNHSDGYCNWAKRKEE